ncbi:chloride channel protein [Acidihalobacter aeolianus]|nr:chloride channel protein [Acidihalobacter aeolianus]
MSTSQSERHRAWRARSLIRWRFMILAALVGVVAGLGAVAFRALIAVFHNALFYGRFGLFYDAQVHMPPSVWGAGVILVPVVGALGVAFLIQRFAPEARGNGVPDVIEANFFHQGRIRPRVAVVRPLASALSLGSGASIGREGPIIQIGAAFASVLGQWLRLGASQLTTLVAAGAGAGIAATFNTPVAGVLFAVELLLAEVGVRTVVPVMFAVSVSTLISHHFLGDSPALPLPLPVRPLGPLTPESFVLYALLGVACGLLAYAFLKGIYATQDLFDRTIANPYLRHASGMLLVGIALYLLQRYAGHYYIQGVGYATLHEVIAGILTHPGFLLLLLVLKYLATCITLGSGASGGIFSPALYLGGTLGAALALPLAQYWPGLGIDPGLFAVAAMAGVIAGATGTALTSIVMMVEMTGDLHVAPPVMLCVALAYVIRRGLSRESAYTVKLLRKGLVVPESLHVSMHYFKRADEAMAGAFSWHPDTGTTADRSTTDSGYRLHVRGGRLSGWQAHSDEAVRTDFVAVRADTLLEDVLIALDEAGARLAVVVQGATGGDIVADRVLGVIGPDEWLGEELADARLFPHGR